MKEQEKPEPKEDPVKVEKPKTPERKPKEIIEEEENAKVKEDKAPDAEESTAKKQDKVETKPEESVKQPEVQVESTKKVEEPIKPEPKVEAKEEAAKVEEIKQKPPTSEETPLVEPVTSPGRERLQADLNVVSSSPKSPERRHKKKGREVVKQPDQESQPEFQRQEVTAVEPPIEKVEKTQKDPLRSPDPERLQADLNALNSPYSPKRKNKKARKKNYTSNQQSPEIKDNEHSPKESVDKKSVEEVVEKQEIKVAEPQAELEKPELTSSLTENLDSLKDEAKPATPEKKPKHQLTSLGKDQLQADLDIINSPVGSPKRKNKKRKKSSKFTN